MKQDLGKVFSQGSRTYYTSSIFFPAEVKEDVFRLYAFFRVADDYVDQIPPDRQGFAEFVSSYHRAMSGSPCGNLVIDSFVELAQRLEFAPSWTEAFLHSMSMDLHKSVYSSMTETLQYMHGSAEVIGLLMSRILSLPEEAYPYAMMQGRAMQLINFIRDIREDLAMGRVYLPLDGLNPSLLEEDIARRHPCEFRTFLLSMLDHYTLWQKDAEKGYCYIPRRYLIPIKTASDMYSWTARVIRNDPFVVYSRKVKPSTGRILLQALANAVRIHAGIAR